MKTFIYQGQITTKTDFSHLLEHYDLILCPYFDKEMSICLDYQNSRKNIIQKLYPELPDSAFSNLLIWSKKKTGEILTVLNPSYQAIFVSDDLNHLSYSAYIKNFSLPVCTRGYTYFHDFYFHILGSHFIPTSFTRWWKTAKFQDEDHFILMAAIIEWTSLKGLSPIIEDILTPNKWGQLELFFNSHPKINRKTINQVYNSYPQILDFIKEWNQIYR